MYPKPSAEYRRDSRWQVFKSTTFELFRLYGPVIFAICLVLFGIVGVRNHGLSTPAIFETLFYAIVITFGVFIMCAGFGLQAATFWYQRKRDK